VHSLPACRAQQLVSVPLYIQGFLFQKIRRGHTTMPCVVQMLPDMYDPSLNHLLASCTYPTPDQLQPASGPQAMPALSASGHQSGMSVAHGMPGNMAHLASQQHALDPALLSSLQAQHQHFFRLQPGIQNSMLMQPGLSHFSMPSLEGMAHRDGSAGVCKSEAGLLLGMGMDGATHGGSDMHALHALASEGSQLGAGVPRDLSAASFAAIQQHALQQHAHLLPFYEAHLHTGFMVPPPGMAIPAPEFTSAPQEAGLSRPLPVSTGPVHSTGKPAVEA
jgi:hypothetical protein